MELKLYIAIFKKNFAVFAALSVAGLVLALFAAKTLPEGYSQSQTFFIANTQIAPDVNSAYYGQEKARNFTDSAVAILQSPDFTREVEGPDSKITTKKTTSQVIRVTSFATTPEGAQSLLSKTQNAFNAKLVSLNVQNLSLVEIEEPPKPALQKINKKVVGVAGLVLGFAFAVFTVSLKTYFKL